MNYSDYYGNYALEHINPLYNYLYLSFILVQYGTYSIP